ncbi:MAG: DUF6261 family protein [Tannerella sp.]|jgi:hypothetical protein|nr:DUF6261 family protein [Tannerella sp.]
METKKFFPVYVSNLKLDNLAGLCTETVDVAGPMVSSIENQLLQVRFNSLQTNTGLLKSLMNRSRKNVLTSHIHVLDKRVGALYSDVKRTSTAAEKSSNATTAAAGSALVHALKPFWKVTAEPMASQLAQLGELFLRVNGNQTLQAALGTLGLGGVWEELSGVNAELNALYDERVAEEAAEAPLPAATKMKETVVRDYEGFCTVTEQLLVALPSPLLEQLFYSIDVLRHTYAPHAKKDLRHAVTEPIEPQTRTGLPLTPPIKLFYEDVPLELGKDYNVTYGNNINAGEGTVTSHGKGKYTGSHTTTFYIV